MELINKVIFAGGDVGVVVDDVAKIFFNQSHCSAPNTSPLCRIPNKWENNLVNVAAYVVRGIKKNSKKF